MASVRFEKGSEEWLMFQDYWKLCQKYWGVENSDQYWDELIKESNEFLKKYEIIPLARIISNAFLDTQEEKCKNNKK